MKLTIKETIDNMIDELSRASEIIDVIRNGGVYENEYLDEVTDDINRTLLDELSFFKERIDLALLMSAAVGDIAIPTCGEIYKVEQNYELPIEDGIIDTEMVYNTVEEATKDVLKNVYGEEEE